MRDDHPAERYRAVMAELDADPPPEPPPAPHPVIVAVPPPPERFDWAAVLRALQPVLLFLLFVVFAVVLYRLTH